MPYAIKRTAIALVESFSLLLIVRAVFSWFPTVKGGRFMKIIYSITEPVLMPMRMLIDSLGIGRNFPFDLSFLITIIALQLLATLIRMT